jgi:hypothetical protein
MTILMLRFGLGNQMFQYASARAVAERRGDKLILDTSQLDISFGGSPPRPYGLDVFRLQPNLVDRAVLQRTGQLPGLLPVFHENRLGFHEHILNVCTRVYDSIVLVGAWQSHKYFEGIEYIIRRDFAFKDSVINRELGKRIALESSSVCLHVRRGDFVSTQLGAHMGFVGLDYYDRAVEYINERVQNAHFYVFSDEIEWCAANLDLKYPHTFVTNAGEAPTVAAQALYLMTRCHHFIIANSTFSWWGAWLGTNRDKIVVTPQKWFSDPQMGDSRDFIPDQWIRV